MHTYVRTRYQYQQYIQQYVPQYHVICGMYVVQQYDAAFGCCCSCHTSTAPVVVFYIWYEYVYFGAINFVPGMWICCCSLWHCVNILLLELLLLLLFVIVHLPPEVFFIQQQCLPSIFFARCTNERSLLLKYTPWYNSLLCGLAFTYYYITKTSLRQYRHARSRRRASARRGEAPLVQRCDRYVGHVVSTIEISD